MKTVTLRIPDALNITALYTVIQSSCAHVPGALEAAKRNAKRNVIPVTEEDLKAVIEFLRLASTIELARVSAPTAIVGGDSSTFFTVSEIK
jgi:hypothetical protein